MTLLVRAPLVAAAIAAVAVTAADALLPFAGTTLGVLAASASAALAAMSVDRPRRLAWSVVGLVSILGAARTLVGPLPVPDLRRVLPIEELRTVLAAPLRSLVPDPESAILLGIVLGERGGIGRELREAFAASGTTHLLAISGFNMTLVAAAVALATRGRVRPAASAALTVLAVVGYSVLVGLAPSVVRAALMATVLALGLALGRPAAGANALGAAVVAMLLVHPDALFDVGFLLSAVATGGLLALHRPIADRLAILPGPVRDGLAATLAATIPTLPIVAGAFGRISLVAPLANLVAVPLFPALMLFGAATSVVGGLWLDAARPLALGAYAFAFALRRVVETSASVPAASVAVPDGALTAAVVATTIIAIVALGRRIGPIARDLARDATARPFADAVIASVRLPSLPPRAALVILIGFAVALGTALAVATTARSPGLRLRALDVGQGDAFLLESRGRYALIDGGPDPGRLLARLGESLPPWHRRIDLVVLTHEHADHGMGLLAVLDRYDVGLAVEPRGMNDVPLVRLWSERLARTGVPRQALAAGSRIRLGDVTFSVLAPGRDRAIAVPSLVIRVEGPGSTMLFMGDATDDVIADLLLAPEALAARVYVPPHHGAASAHASALVAAVRPEAAVLSVGASNRYGHPAPETMTALGAIATYRTDRDGTVELEFDGPRIVVRARTSGLPPHRGGSVPRAASSR